MAAGAPASIRRPARPPRTSSGTGNESALSGPNVLIAEPTGLVSSCRPCVFVPGRPTFVGACFGPDSFSGPVGSVKLPGGLLLLFEGGTTSGISFFWSRLVGALLAELRDPQLLRAGDVLAGGRVRRDVLVVAQVRERLRVARERVRVVDDAVVQVVEQRAPARLVLAGRHPDRQREQKRHEREEEQDPERLGHRESRRLRVRRSVAPESLSWRSALYGCLPTVCAGNPVSLRQVSAFAVCLPVMPPMKG